MPQLLPHPWFLILITSWLILLILLPKKILSHISTNNPLPTPANPQHTPWTWPWH